MGRQFFGTDGIRGKTNAGVMTAAIVLALGKKSHATLLYALTGLGYLIFAPAAAVYSTRELALEGAVFRALSIVNHFGALFFTASLTALPFADETFDCAAAGASACGSGGQSRRACGNRRRPRHHHRALRRSPA